MPRKAVRTISVSGITGALLSATTGKGASVEVDKIAAYGDLAYTSVPRNVKSYDDFTFTFLDEGGAVAALSSQIGHVVAVTVSVSFGDGKGADSASSLGAIDMVIKSVSPGGAVDVDGDRKATVVVTAVPHC